MKIVFLAVFLMQFTTTACAFDTIPLYKEEIDEMIRDPKTRQFKGSENDAGDLSGCEVLIDESYWTKRVKGNYGRSQHWRKGTMNTHTGLALDLKPSRNLYVGHRNLKMVLEDKLDHLIFIGPWRPITLTKPIPASFTLTHLFTSREQTEADLIKSGLKQQKLIRFFAYNPKEGGDITYQYESQTEENKSITEKAFSLSPAAKIPPDRFGLCVVKWTAKYGYNAIAEVKSKNPFSKNYLVPTGRIIDAETGKVIEDKE